MGENTLMSQESEVAKYFDKFNVVTVKEDNKVPRSCKYYLHFDINLPYPEQELKTCIANQIWKKSYPKKEQGSNRTGSTTTKTRV